MASSKKKGEVSIQTELWAVTAVIMADTMTDNQTWLACVVNMFCEVRGGLVEMYCSYSFNKSIFADSPTNERQSRT